MCIGVFVAYMSVPGARGQKRTSEPQSPWNKSYSCEPPCGYWELNPGLLEEQPVLLATQQLSSPLLLAISVNTVLTVVIGLCND